MKNYLIVKCSNCGEVRVTTASKTFRCYKCGKINRLEKENILAYASDAEEARMTILKLKQYPLDK
ncbi:MAG: DUF1922 domain-containing protein [Halobacteria archaeon]